MNLPTFSRIEQAMICEASEIWEPRIRSVSSAADRGSWLHWYLANVGRLGPEALDGVPEEWRPAAEAIELEALPQIDPAGYAHEVAMAWDYVTGAARELHRGGGRDYSSLAATEYAGTLDVLGLTADGASAFVADWKTGRKRLPPASRLWQLRAGALAACRLFGRAHAVVAIVYLREDGTPWFDRAEFDAMDMDDTAVALIDLAARIETARQTRQPQMITGSHCRYCQVRLSCPATTALVLRLASNPMDVKREINALAPDDVARGWHLYQQAKAILDEIRDSLVGAALAMGGVPLGNGMILAERETRRETVSGPVVHEVLERLFGRTVADMAVEMESSKAAIDRVLKPMAAEQDRPMAQLRRDVLDEIRRQGGVDVKVSSRIDEYAVKESS